MTNPKRTLSSPPVERKPLDAVQKSSSPPQLKSRSHLLSLPLEICTEILALLEARDITVCSKTCKLLHALVSSSITLQYTLTLAAYGMRDGPSSLPLSVSERSALLQVRCTSWRTLILDAPTASIHLPGLCKAYDLVGGFYGKCIGDLDDDSSGDTITLVTLPSSNPPRDVKVETHDLGMHPKDFTTDPSQDLMALLEWPGQDGLARIHIRRFSEPEVMHPDAGVEVLEARMDGFTHESECMVDVADDIVALYVREIKPSVVVSNWRTGEALVNMELPRHAVPPDDFSFVSPRAFLVTYAHTDAIRLFSFTSPSSSQRLEVTATLRLPPPARGARFVLLNATTGPWLAQAPPLSAHFPLNERRIHMLNLRIEDADARLHELMIIVHARTLMSIIRAALSRLSWPPPSPILSPQGVEEAEANQVWSWQSWITPSARVIAMRQQFEWQRYVHGARLLARGVTGLHMLDFDVPLKGDERDKWRDTGIFAHHSISIWEGQKKGVPIRGMLNMRGNAAAGQHTDGGGAADGDDDEIHWAVNLVIDEVAAINNDPLIELPVTLSIEREEEQEEQEIVSSLPYGCVCIPIPGPPKDKFGGRYTGFMLDEQRIVGVRRVADGEVLDVWTF